MFFIRIHLERLNISRFLETFISNIELNKDTIFSIDVNKGHTRFDLGLTLILPPNQRNFVERLAGALNMAGFSISLARESELEDQWIAPLEITRGASLRISRKHKNYIQVLGSPTRFITLLRSTTLPPLTMTNLIHTLESTSATILCKVIGNNKVAVEIIIAKLHSEKTELDQFRLPNEFAEYFTKVTGRRPLTNAVKNLLIRNCSKGIKLSLQELREFFVGELTIV
jgi:hypothetical protein